MMDLGGFNIPAPTEPKEEKCSWCKGIGYIFYLKDGYEYANECHCRTSQKIIDEKNKTAILDLTKDFDDYKPVSEGQEEALKLAKKYVEKNREKSFLLCGQPGSGKTMLISIMARHMIEKGRKVIAVSYPDMMQKLKAHVMDSLEFDSQMSKLKKCEVLVIDDLLKGATSQTDIKYLFEIVNYRCVNKKPLLVSTEKTATGLLEFDEAIGSRLLEMTGEFKKEFRGKNLNHRLGL